jgi:hypothetical protein
MSGAGDVVGECAAQRENLSAGGEISIAQAIDQARWLRRTPDGIVSADVARRVIDTLLAALEVNPAYLKAVAKNEPTFVLRAQDLSSPTVIGTWAQIAAAHGCGEDKVQEALAKAALMERWANRKWPD